MLEPLWLALAAAAALAGLGLLLVLLTRGRALAWLVAALPGWLQRAAGRALGALLALVGPRRAVARANLLQAFPQASDAERAAILSAFYAHLGQLTVEFLRAPALSDTELDELVEVEGLEGFRAAYAEGKGAIVVTAHFGNFELLGSLWHRRGIEVHAITKRLAKNAFNAFWLDQRRRAGLRELPDSGSIRDILRVLRDGKTLAIMIDQNMIPRRAIFAPFFGRLAATTPAPAIFAERTAAPVFLVLLHRLPEGRHRATIEGPLPFARSGDRDVDVAAFTALLNERLEAHVRAAPSHWWWVHRRWKTRPPDEPPG